MRTNVRTALRQLRHGAAGGRAASRASSVALRFSEPLLRRVCAVATDDFDGAVAALRRAELIHEESLYPEVEYAFRHPLTHEVAERSQLAAQRSRVHVAVASALEELHADKADENAALLAHHWDLGGEVEPAARWHRRAAEWIRGSNAPEARLHERRADLARQRGDAAEAVGRPREARQLYQEMGAPLQLERLDRADLSSRNRPLDL